MPRLEYFRGLSADPDPAFFCPHFSVAGICFRQKDGVSTMKGASFPPAPSFNINLPALDISR
jgi:hypothetical protein